MVLKINGIDIMKYIAAGGLKWQRSDLESPSAGRTMDGVMHRGRVATKIRLDITCRPLTGAETQVLLKLIFPEYVDVEYDDPMYGHVVKTMYSNNNPAKLVMVFDDEDQVWSGIEFPLVER